MDEFSPAELFILEQSAINLQFEFWLTVTFAVIVASFVAGRQLVQKLRVAIAFLYALAVVVFLSRWYYAAIDSEFFREALNDAGVAINLPWVTVFSRVVLVVLGTTATLTFLLRKELYTKPDK
jgi:Ca2+/Na+ antiporter